MQKVLAQLWAESKLFRRKTKHWNGIRSNMRGIQSLTNSVSFALPLLLWCENLCGINRLNWYEAEKHIKQNPNLIFFPPMKEHMASDVIFDMSTSFLCHIALFISVLLCPSYSPHWGGNQFQRVTEKDGSILKMQPGDRGGDSQGELWARTHICLHSHCFALGFLFCDRVIK